MDGLGKRLARIFREDRKTVIVPMDHGVTLGPMQGLQDMHHTISNLLEAKVDAFVIHKGIAKAVNTGSAGLIIHVSASTKHSPDPNRKVSVCSVLEALRLGADAVSVHINVGAPSEAEMLVKLGEVADECHGYGLPLLAMMYPRGPSVKNEHEKSVVAHVARLGAELGADIVKTNYTGDPESFKEVVQSCPVPLIIAGGPKSETDRDVLQMVYDADRAGCAGISIGRNVFQHRALGRMARALIAIVHENTTVDDALSLVGGNR
jgi:fructose-bisphosphate aldolase/2-amino-3,7-dideoxy-D-threo-hept-6-ulosonate synthase